MTKYREILRLHSLGHSIRGIALSVPCSRNTASRTVKLADEAGLKWQAACNMTDGEIEKLLFANSNNPQETDRAMPDFEYMRKELQKNGVTKKLLWTEYLEDCKQSGKKPLMYSQFCYHFQQYEEQKRATMHINRKPGEQVEVDWAGDPAEMIDPETGEIVKAWVFVGAMSYSQYAYAEAFLDEKQNAWITAHVHMYQYLGGVPKILVSDNCRTAVIHTGDWFTQELNTTYHEMAEHYGTAIIPARVRRPKDKPLGEGGVGNISTQIIAALRNEQFFSLAALNKAICEKLEKYNTNHFTKKDGSRRSIYLEEELPLLRPLPVTPYEASVWKEPTVQYNYHVSFDNMYYSVPHSFIGKKVNLRATSTTIEIYFNHNRIATHARMYGRKGQYSTVTEHMPKTHQEYLEWNGDRFRKWAAKIGPNTQQVVDGLLTTQRVEQQAYRACMGLLKLSEKYSVPRLEAACQKALGYTATPSYKSVKNILASGVDVPIPPEEEKPKSNPFALTRGADYYKGR